MIMALGLTVSNIDRGQRMEGSVRNELDYNFFDVQFGTIYCTVSETLGLIQIFSIIFRLDALA